MSQSWRRWWREGAVLLGFLALYRFTSPPSVGWIDSGVLAAAATSLGIPNPPGFPTFVLIGHIFSLLPLGDGVDRLQWLSHLAALGVIAVVGAWTQALTQKRWPGIWSMILMGGSYSLWSQATNIETFTLTNACLAGALWLTWKIGATLTDEKAVKKNTPAATAQKGKGRSPWKTTNLMLLTAVLLALGAGLNPMFAAVVPPGLWWLWQHQTVLQKNHTRTVILAAGGVVLGVLAIYSFLPLRAVQHPFLNWGDPSTPERLWKHLTGAGLNIYEPETNSINGFTGQPVVMLWSLGYFLLSALVQFTPLALPLVGGGWRWLHQRERQTFWLLTLCSLTNFGFVLLYYGGNQESWMLSSWWGWAICAGVGAHSLYETITAQTETTLHHHQWRVRGVQLGLVGVMLAPLLFWAPILNHRHHTYSADFAQNLYKNLPPNAVVIGGGDFFHSVSNLERLVNQTRPDVIPITGNMFYIFPWYRENLRQNTDLVLSLELEAKAGTITETGFTEVIDQLVQDNPTRPIFVTPLILRESVIAGTNKGVYASQKYGLRPHGLLLQVVVGTNQQPPDEESFSFTFGTPFTQQQPYYLERNYRGAYDLVRTEYADAYARLAEYWWQQGNLEKAANWFSQSQAIGSPYSGQFVHRAAIFYATTNQLEKARELFRESLQREPNNLAMIENYQIFLAESTKSASLQPTQPAAFPNLGAAQTSGSNPLPLEAFGTTNGPNLAPTGTPIRWRIPLTATQLEVPAPAGWTNTPTTSGIHLQKQASSIQISAQPWPLQQSWVEFLAKLQQADLDQAIVLDQGSAQVSGFSQAFLRVILPTTDAAEPTLEFSLFHQNPQSLITVKAQLRKEDQLQAEFDVVLKNLRVTSIPTNQPR